MKRKFTHFVLNSSTEDSPHLDDMASVSRGEDSNGSCHSSSSTTTCLLNHMKSSHHHHHHHEPQAKKRAIMGQFNPKTPTPGAAPVFTAPAPPPPQTHAPKTSHFSTMQGPSVASSPWCTAAASLRASLRQNGSISQMMAEQSIRITAANDAPPVSSQSTNSEPKRNSAVHTCLHCKRAHAKCSGYPGCNRCKQRNLKCYKSKYDETLCEKIHLVTRHIGERFLMDLFLPSHIVSGVSQVVPCQRPKLGPKLSCPKNRVSVGVASHSSPAGVCTHYNQKQKFSHQKGAAAATPINSSAPQQKEDSPTGAGKNSTTTQWSPTTTDISQFLKESLSDDDDDNNNNYSRLEKQHPFITLSNTSSPSSSSSPCQSPHSTGNNSRDSNTPPSPRGTHTIVLKQPPPPPTENCPTNRNEWDDFFTNSKRLVLPRTERSISAGPDLIRAHYHTQTPVSMWIVEDLSTGGAATGSNTAPRLCPITSNRQPNQMSRRLLLCNDAFCEMVQYSGSHKSQLLGASAAIDPNQLTTQHIQQWIKWLPENHFEPNFSGRIKVKIGSEYYAQSFERHYNLIFCIHERIDHFDDEVVMNGRLYPATFTIAKGETFSEMQTKRVVERMQQVLVDLLMACRDQLMRL